MFFISIIVFASACTYIAMAHMVAIEESAETSHPDYVLDGKPSGNTFHEVVFVLKPRNMDILSNLLDEISDPRSSKYGQYLSLDEITEITSNTDGFNALKNYLQSHGVTEISPSSGGDYVTVKAPVSVLETVLGTSFSNYKKMSSGEQIIRTSKYYLPEELVPYVSSVRNTVQFPTQTKLRPVPRPIPIAP